MSREQFRFSSALRVRWAEVDKQGIVFNAHYLTYFDVAVTDYWRAIGCAYPGAFVDHGVDTFVVKATLEYRGPAEFDDTLDVLVRSARIGRSSLRLLFEIHRTDEHLVSGELTYVFANPESRKPTPVPEAFRGAIRAYEITSPEFAP